MTISNTFKALQKSGYIAIQNLKTSTTWESINHPMFRYLQSKSGNTITHRWGTDNLIAQGAVWTRKTDYVADNGYRVYYYGSQTEGTNRPTTHEVGQTIEIMLAKYGLPTAGHYQSDIGAYILIPSHSKLR
jgi:hypothetical protein